jgi:hypothetical protein
LFLGLAALVSEVEASAVSFKESMIRTRISSRVYFADRPVQLDDRGVGLFDQSGLGARMAATMSANTSS